MIARQEYLSKLNEGFCAALSFHRFCPRKKKNPYEVISSSKLIFNILRIEDVICNYVYAFCQIKIVLEALNIPIIIIKTAHADIFSIWDLSLRGVLPTVQQHHKTILQVNSVHCSCAIGVTVFFNVVQLPLLMCWITICVQEGAVSVFRETKTWLNSADLSWHVVPHASIISFTKPKRPYVGHMRGAKGRFINASQSPLTT